MMLVKKNLLKIAVSTALLASATACSSSTEAVAAAAPAPTYSGDCDPVSRRVGGCHRGASLSATGYQGEAALQHADAVWGECLTMVKHAPYWMGIGPNIEGSTVSNKAIYESKTVKRKPRAATAAETAAYYKKKGWSTTPVVIKRETETRVGETVVINKPLDPNTTYSGGPSKPAIVPAPSSNVYTHGSHSGHNSGHGTHGYSQPTYGGAQPNVINPRSARRDVGSSQPAIQRPVVQRPTIQRPAIQRPTIAPPKAATIQRPAIKPPTMIKPPQTIRPPALSAPTIQPPAIKPPTVTAPTVTAPAITPPAITPPAAPAPKIRKPLKLKLKSK